MAHSTYLSSPQQPVFGEADRGLMEAAKKRVADEYESSIGARMSYIKRYKELLQVIQESASDKASLQQHLEKRHAG